MNPAVGTSEAVHTVPVAMFATGVEVPLPVTVRTKGEPAAPGQLMLKVKGMVWASAGATLVTVTEPTGPAATRVLVKVTVRVAPASTDTKVWFGWALNPASVVSAAVHTVPWGMPVTARLLPSPVTWRVKGEPTTPGQAMVKVKTASWASSGASFTTCTDPVGTGTTVRVLVKVTVGVGPTCSRTMVTVWFG